MANISAATNAHKPTVAHAAVRTLEADISHLRATNRIAPADASVLLTDAGQIDRKLSTPATSATPATPAAPAANPPPPGPGHGKHGPGKGKGHGPGDGGGDGGD
ncbi:MAG TPA: hypothetical protein VMG37_05545 [Solirubrobacteraceae bacterium]|nr:hypothetical protein [Solirubrobacteraceae bacterium]